MLVELEKKIVEVKLSTHLVYSIPIKFRISHYHFQEGDEPLEQDELPAWKRTYPKMDLTKLNPNNAEEMVRKNQQGKTLMLFVTISGKLILISENFGAQHELPFNTKCIFFINAVDILCIFNYCDQYIK